MRANVGAQYTMTFSNGAYINALVGQSYHLAGRNSFVATSLTSADQVNAGANSGLDKSKSDYVARFAFQPAKGISFVARGRFDEETLRLQRLELSALTTVGSLTTSLLYARQEAQPDLGFVRRREGLALSNSYKLPNNWFVSNSITVDLDRYLTDRDLSRTSPGLLGNAYNNSPFRLASYGVGVGYSDECTIFSLNYSRSVSDNLGSKRSTVTTVLFRLELKHLGQLNYRQTVNGTPTADGSR